MILYEIWKQTVNFLNLIYPHFPPDLPVSFLGLQEKSSFEIKLLGFLNFCSLRLCFNSF